MDSQPTDSRSNMLPQVSRLSKISSDFYCYKDGKGRFVWRDFPSFLAVIVYRYGHWCHNLKYKVIRYLLYLTYFPCSWFTWITTGIQIPKSTRIGKGLRIHHWGNIIINGQAVIGDYMLHYYRITKQEISLFLMQSINIIKHQLAHLL